MINIGIDLGTTNTVVHVYHNDNYEIIQFKGASLLPSCIYYDGRRLLVGRSAKSHGIAYPNQYIHSSKRDIGTNKTYTILDRTFTPKDVAVEILKEIKKQVLDTLKVNDSIKAVITIPANFDSAAINDTKEAGLSVFDEVEILKEPVSSVIGYGELIGEETTYLVCDFGGGTYDTSVVEKSGNEYNVLYTGGDEKLGGNDFTKVIIDMIYDEIASNERYGYINFNQENIDDDPMGLKTIFDTQLSFLKAKTKIYNEAEKAKIDLSSNEEVRIYIASLYSNNGEAIPFDYNITRRDFEDRARSLFNKIESCTEDMLEHINGDHYQVMLVGGSIQIPKVKEIIRNLTHKEPLDRDPDTIVSLGACIKACHNQEEVKITNVIKDNLGLKISNNTVDFIIPAQSQCPCSKSKIYTTANDNQTFMILDIVEGENPQNVYDETNHIIASLQIDNIPKAPKGEPQVEVTFRLDAQGILSVNAKDLNNPTNEVNATINWEHGE